jgi:hypothetical protein
MILIGGILLVLPGIYLLIVFSLIPPIMVIEKMGFSDALSRAFKLITEKWWSTCGLIFIMSIIVWFMSLIFSIPQGIFSFLTTLHGTDSSIQTPVWQEAGMIISSIIYSAGAGLLQSLVYLSLAFQLYNLIERKEAKGLMSKLENFGKPAEQQPPAFRRCQPATHRMWSANSLPNKLNHLKQIQILSTAGPNKLNLSGIESNTGFYKLLPAYSTLPPTPFWVRFYFMAAVLPC